jgi:predicted mannosyl-3-phosphoglycerate phosphatase (HAD superfamily)
MKVAGKIFSIDFDGTLVDHSYPDIGEPLPMAFEVLKKIKEAGGKLILWTCREDSKRRKYLTEAVEFCKTQGVEFDAINETLLDKEFREPPSLMRKPYANYIIDDSSFNVTIDWQQINDLLDWE